MKSFIFYIILTMFCLTTGFSQNKRTDYSQLAEKVKTEFLHTWNGYKEYAWGHDDLKPISKTYHDWYDVPFLMTPVDAFDTMLLMGLDEEANEAKELIFNNLSFDVEVEVQFFEINIRLLGGLLSAYQLDGDKKFLELAVDLADKLLPAFDSPTGMPYRYVNLKTGEVKDENNNPAEIGTLILEWGTLSKLTGKEIYYQKAKDALREVYKRRSPIDLVGEVINVETGEWQDSSSHISGRIDSYYEYLLKGSLLFDDEELNEMWQTSIKAVNKYLPDEAETGFWYGWVNMYTGKRTETYFGALDAFIPAMLSLNGDLELAKKLQESCYKLWMLEGIEPELINYSTMEIIAPYYMLRPENIESAYYLFHLTGDEKYREMGKEYFESIVKFCRNETGYCSLKSVITKEKSDEMQSFFLAETLKYAYLLFAEQDKIDFNKTIFNTEAHPLKIWK